MGARTSRLLNFSRSECSALSASCEAPLGDSNLGFYFSIDRVPYEPVVIGSAIAPDLTGTLAQRLAMQGLQSQVDDLRRQLAAACIDRDEAARALAQRVKEANDLNRTISARDEQIKHLNDRVRATVEERNRSVMYQGDCAASARKECEAARKDRDDLREQLNSFTAQLVKADGEREDLRAINTRLRQDVERASAQYVKAEEELTRLRLSPPATANVRIRQLEEDLSNARIQLSNTQTTRDHHWRTVGVLQKKLAAVREAAK